MTFNQSSRRILFRLVLLGLSLLLFALLLVFRLSWLAGVLAIFLLLQLVGIYKAYGKIQQELDDFAEAVHYRDFTRRYDATHASADLQSLRRSFNTINDTLKAISKERETQHHYLEQILEMVDTAILSYEEEDGTIGWMNEAFRQLLNLPYLRTIHSLEKKDAALYREILSLNTHESRVLSISGEKSMHRLLLSASTFRIEGRKYKVLAFQNIAEVLEENESNAWQKLLSVMTHEIMNSIAPISSLADTLSVRLQKGNEAHAESLPEDLQLGIDAIRRRSEGLLKFAETYRNLNRISELKRSTVYVRHIFENLQRLMQPTLEQKNIELEIILKGSNLSFSADASLVEQMLINLVLNAAEALTDAANPKIMLSAEETLNHKVLIRVEDNGTGIPADQLDRIFIPFFTGRKNGTGVGLSFCKQIMTLHRGTVQVQSTEGKGAVFTLSFS